MAETILALVEDAERSQGFIDATLTLVEFRQAHLVIELLTTVPLLSPETAPFGAAYALLDDLERRAFFTKADLIKRMPADLSVEVVTQVDGSAYLPGDVRRSAPVADIVTVGSGDSWENDRLRRHAIETMLLTAGAPMLLVPPGRSLRKIDHAVVGWKHGAPAIRAVRELVRLASPGARVDVVHVGGDVEMSRSSPCNDVKDYLERHGFAVELHVVKHDEPVADRLQAFALDRGADLLAIGGYAHSRAREIVFGGVTRTVVDDPRIPVLLAH